MTSAAVALLGGASAIDVSQHVRWPVLGDDDRRSVIGVLDRGVLSGPFAPEVRGFEREFASYVGAKQAIATNSGTAALHLAVAAAGIGPGDEVITSAYSFVATALAVLHANAVPVFVDVEPKTWGLDPDLVEKAITARTKAIMPVHIHGTPCAIDSILAIARRHQLLVIEDAAQAHGASVGDKKVGTFGLGGAFSLQSSKSLAAGEGGVLVTDDDGFAARARQLRGFGENVDLADEASYRVERALDGDRAYDSISMGWMYRPTELACAIARSQLKKLDRWSEAARRNAAALSARLSELPGVEPITVPAGSEGTIHKFRVRFDASKVGVDAPPTIVRDALVKALRAEGVEAVLWQTQPVPGQTLFRNRDGSSLEKFPRTVDLLDRSVVLFSQTYPIACQPLALAEAYGDVFAKVWGRLGEIVDHLRRESAGARG